MTEREITPKFMAALRAIPNSWWYKIADVPGKTGKKPFDIIGHVQGHAIAIECKIHGKKLKPHQVDALCAFYDEGGTSYAVYFVDGKCLIYANKQYLFHEFTDLIKAQLRHPQPTHRPQ